ncbi:hypothetical protein OHB53_10975 [Streptomyces sp. NBC_00056]|uniref:hypothetical protein n=1 Tax=Streptomyces sp. NBC_00056 TaxID=2975633 RepID=UPI00325346F1
MEPEAFSTAGGGSNSVRVHVTTNAGVHNREQQLRLVKDISALIAKAAGDASLAERTWVSLTVSVPCGWGIGAHAYTNQEIVRTARKLLGRD